MWVRTMFLGGYNNIIICLCLNHCYKVYVARNCIYYRWELFCLFNPITSALISLSERTLPWTTSHLRWIYWRVPRLLRWRRAGLWSTTSLTMS